MESHLYSEIEDSEIAIDGWSLFRGDRLNRKCGGSIIYVKDGLPIAKETSYSNEYCEMVAVYVANRNVALISVYRLPSCPTYKF